MRRQAKPKHYTLFNEECDDGMAGRVRSGNSSIGPDSCSPLPAIAQAHFAEKTTSHATTNSAAETNARHSSQRLFSRIGEMANRVSHIQIDVVDNAGTTSLSPNKVSNISVHDSTFEMKDTALIIKPTLSSEECGSVAGRVRRGNSSNGPDSCSPLPLPTNVTTPAVGHPPSKRRRTRRRKTGILLHAEPENHDEIAYSIESPLSDCSTIRSIYPIPNSADSPSSNRALASMIVLRKTPYTTKRETRKQKKRRLRKDRKLDLLAKATIGSHIITGDRLQETPCFFAYHPTFRFSSANELFFVRYAPRAQICIYNSCHFSIVDTCGGASYRGPFDNSSADQLAFILLPRDCSLRSLGHVPANSWTGNKAELDIAMMEDYLRLTRGRLGCKRGSDKLSDDAGSYPNPGLKANRGARGIIESNYNLEQVLNCSNETPSYMMQLNSLARRSERLIDEYIPTNDLRSLAKAKEVNAFPTMTGPRGVFATSAISVDYSSASHTDRDFFHTVLSVRSFDKSPDNMLPFDCNYADSPEPVHHFMFPTIGIAVALRPGDHLIFNPNVPHCCSDKFSAYMNHRTYLCAMYLKIAVVGQNDNKLQLTSLQKSILHPLTGQVHSELE